MKQRKNITIRSSEVDKLLRLDENEMKVYLALKSDFTADEISQVISLGTKKIVSIEEKLQRLELVGKKAATTTQEIMQEAGTNQDFAMVLERAQKFQRNDLSLQQIVELYKVMSLGIDTEVLLYTMAMLQEKKKYSAKYFVKTAETLKNRNVFHMEDLQDESDIRNHNLTAKTVATEFGISRGLTPSEIRYIKKWEEYNFSPEDKIKTLAVIRRACEKTVLLTGKVSFPYCDSMLKNWAENKVKTLEDVEELERYHVAKKKEEAAKARNKGISEKKNAYGTPKPNKFHNFEQHNTDYDALVLQRLKERMDQSDEDK